MNNLAISPMKTEEEIYGKAYVHYQSWQESYDGLVDAAYLKKLTLETCREIAHRWPDNILVAKADGKVIGFVAYGTYRDQALPQCGEIYAIYVLQEYHGRQVGFELMNAAVEQLAGYSRIAVWVLKGNDKAVRFYERYGFHFDGTEQQISLGAPNTECRMIFERKQGN